MICLTRQREDHMENFIQQPTVYFSSRGAENTRRTLELARDRAQETGIETVLVATTTGAAGVEALKVLPEASLVIVTHSTGFAGPDTQELTAANRQVLEASQARVLTCQHAFGGVNRAVRKKLGTYELDEIIAYTLRIFGQGVKVAVEMVLMAADAGLIRTDRPVICVAGTGSGADTAVMILPSNAQNFFDLRILEIICMPADRHPAFS
jgi:hypothetical protein